MSSFSHQYAFDSFATRRREHPFSVFLHRPSWQGYGYGHLWPELELSWQREEGQRTREGSQMARSQMEERKKKERAGQLLGIDLSKVPEERWAEFGTHILSEYGNFRFDGKDPNEEKDLIILGDLFSGGKSKFVNDEKRKSKEYIEHKTWLRDKWEEWDKNNE
jgi:hypothetical protein